MRPLRLALQKPGPAPWECDDAQKPRCSQELPVPLRTKTLVQSRAACAPVPWECDDAQKPRCSRELPAPLRTKTPVQLRAACAPAPWECDDAQNPGVVGPG